MAARENRKKGAIITGRYLLSLMLLISLMTAAASAVIGKVDVSAVYQELEGFGASNVWDGSTLVGLANRHPEIYDIIFGDLGLDILRLRNTYGYGWWESQYINRCAEVISEGRARTGRPLKIMISSWTPPAYLKSNNNLNGGDDATLAGGPDNYVYEDYADWWAESVQEYASQGIDADYISMQNEPDYDADWQSCRFNPAQGSVVAGYDMAFEAVYAELHSRMGSAMPKMLAPEAASIAKTDDYIRQLEDLSHVYGFAHHLYGCSDGLGGAGCAHEPDYYISRMTRLNTGYGYKPLFQTEYSDDTHVVTHQAAIDLAVLIHNSLVYEQVSAYMYWWLTGEPNVGLVSITQSSWAINPIYYAFKHFSAFTDPGWHRVDTSLSGHGASMLRMSAFMSPDNDELTIVIINLDYWEIPLMINLDWFSPDSSEVYQSTETDYWQYIGPMDTSIELGRESITTIHMTGNYISDCAEVQTEGYGLNSDINDDCYVNCEDLRIIADYWLSSDCDWLNDYCDGADFEPRDNSVDLFDLGIFSSQWMQCDDPQDPNCTMIPQ